MSSVIVKAVLKHGPQDLEHRFALVALATFARNDGWARVPVRALVHRSTSDFKTMTGLLADLLREGWFTRCSPASGAAEYQFDLGRLGIAPLPHKPELKVRRAIGSVLDAGPACAHCGAPLATETPAMEGQS